MDDVCDDTDTMDYAEEEGQISEDTGGVDPGDCALHEFLGTLNKISSASTQGDRNHDFLEQLAAEAEMKNGPEIVPAVAKLINPLLFSVMRTYLLDSIRSPTRPKESAPRRRSGWASSWDEILSELTRGGDECPPKALGQRGKVFKHVQSEITNK